MISIDLCPVRACIQNMKAEEENDIEVAVATYVENTTHNVLQELENTYANVQEEFNNHRENMIEVIGPEFVHDIENDIVWQQVGTQEFDDKYLKHSAPIVRTWADIFMRRRHVEQQLDRAHREHELSNMTPAQVYAHVEQLERRVLELEQRVTNMEAKCEESEWEHISDLHVMTDIYHPCIDSSGKYFAFYRLNTGICIYDIDTQQLQLTIEEKNINKDAKEILQWHPTHPILVYKTISEIRAWDVVQQRHTQHFIADTDNEKYSFWWVDDDIYYFCIKNRGTLKSSAGLSISGKLPNVGNFFISRRKNFLAIIDNTSQEARNRNSRILVIFDTQSLRRCFDHEFGGSCSLTSNNFLWDIEDHLYFTCNDKTIIIDPINSTIVNELEAFELRGNLEFCLTPSFPVDPSSMYYNTLVYNRRAFRHIDNDQYMSLPEDLTKKSVSNMDATVYCSGANKSHPKVCFYRRRV